MTGVDHRTVAGGEAEMRLDRWFRQHFPALGHGRLEKLLRTGQIRVDGKRAKASQRLEAGQTVRVPPLGDLAAPKPPPARPAVDAAEAAKLKKLVLYRDDAVIALNKPPGMAVQGGAKTGRHLDALLDALRFDAEERPRLVHRLDRDTSGVLLLARSAAAARALTAAFKAKTTVKEYWALVVGVPKPAEGRIDLALMKAATGKAFVPDDDTDEDAKKAVTFYRVVEQAAKRAAWLALWPQTGRTHQLRVHAAAIGTPILGDGKYGGRDAFLPGAEVAAQLHLHARRLTVAHPTHPRQVIDVTAPLPDHMAQTFDWLGFDPKADVGPPP
ncbi:MAG: RluA family pseudouridine synthase [Alphaproteobacteria bacterium]|jgi:23S rRNA pseudouridine955/2504/2580 synthase|nr:RluA family pseudouridine synthase [Alphaproteobacteria bacterium]